MSISGLIDELRKSADEWNGSNMFELARMCSEAADTIWQLRCRLVDAEDRVRKSVELCKLCEREAENAKLRKQVERMRTENAKLRSELDSVGTAAYLYGRSDFKAENAKLRELVRDMFNGMCEYNRRIRELGLEV